ncbi:MAG: hypothetical protein ACJA0K_000642 [Maricaulis maris]
MEAHPDLEPDREHVRNRPPSDGKTKDCLNRKTGLARPFGLMMSAQLKWRKLDGAIRRPEIVHSETGSNNCKQPPNHAVTTFRALLKSMPTPGLWNSSQLFNQIPPKSKSDLSLFSALLSGGWLLLEQRLFKSSFRKNQLRGTR